MMQVNREYYAVSIDVFRQLCNCIDYFLRVEGCRRTHISSGTIFSINTDICIYIITLDLHTSQIDFHYIYVYDSIENYFTYYVDPMIQNDEIIKLKGPLHD